MQTQKELLDMELELYNQQSEGADTSALKQRVEQLRKEVCILYRLVFTVWGEVVNVLILIQWV